MGKEIDDYLPILLHKFLERSLVRCLNSENRLRSSIYIPCILEFRLGIEVLVHIDNNDITNQF